MICCFFRGQEVHGIQEQVAVAEEIEIGVGGEIHVAVNRQVALLGCFRLLGRGRPRGLRDRSRLDFGQSPDIKRSLFVRLGVVGDFIGLYPVLTQLLIAGDHAADDGLQAGPLGLPVQGQGPG